MSELKALVDQYIDTHGSSQSWVAGQIGMSRSALNAWWTVGRKSAPSSDQLRALSKAIRVPYKFVLDAALTDYGYLPIERAGEDRDRSSSITDASVTRLPRREQMIEDATREVPAARGHGGEGGNQSEKHGGAVGSFEPPADPEGPEGGA